MRGRRVVRCYHFTLRASRFQAAFIAMVQYDQMACARFGELSASSCSDGSFDVPRSTNRRTWRLSVVAGSTLTQ